MNNIIFKKSMALIGIGVLFLIVGAVYGLLSGDGLFIGMSTVIFAVNVYKVFELRKIVRENKYIVISGECVEAEYKLMGKYRLYKIKNNDGAMEISVPKSVKLKINESYRLYFKNMPPEAETYGAWLKNKILSESFLGYEVKLN